MQKALCLIILINLIFILHAGEISRRKCQEYEIFSKKRIYYGLNSSGAPKYKENSTCNNFTPLIVGGTKAKKHEFPHFALIGFNERGRKTFKCGGSIISENFILTAAHCRYDNGIEASFVRVGEHAYKANNLFRKDIDIQEFINHENYTQDYATSLLNDIALVKLTQSINFSLEVRPACLHQNKSEILLKRTFVAIGMGALGHGEISSDILMKVNLTVVHPNQCRDLSLNVTSQICLKGLHSPTGKKDEFGDTCGGDSGGPISLRHKDNHCMFDLYGVTSYGKPCGYGFGAVYTRVSYYLPWIEKIVWGSDF